MKNSMAESTGDLERAKALLTGQITCAIVRGEHAETSTLRGVAPLLTWLEGDFAGYSAADKVVGRAAAFLYVLLGVKALYAAVLSKPAEEVLREHGISVSYGTLAERIVNRAGDGLCPMESATMGENDPVRALEKIKAKRRELMQKGG